MKNRFFGKYYKYVSKDGFNAAIIFSCSNEGGRIQLITKEKSYLDISKEEIYIDKDILIINIHRIDITMIGRLKNKELHPLKKDPMGPFRFFNLECKHNIYSMYHDVEGYIIYNNIIHNINYGYIEGDEGTNFPNKYIWYNSIGNNYGLTLAVASIPLGLFSFTGLLCFIKYKDKEYYLSTYNLGRILKISKEHIKIKKGYYSLDLYIDETYINKSKDLKAPIRGDMSRYIKENISIPSRIIFKYKKVVILDIEDNVSSYEYNY